jgi:hypothetical protein
MVSAAQHRSGTLGEVRIGEKADLVLERGSEMRGPIVDAGESDDGAERGLRLGGQTAGEVERLGSRIIAGDGEPTRLG